MGVDKADGSTQQKHARPHFLGNNRQKEYEERISGKEKKQELKIQVPNAILEEFVK